MYETEHPLFKVTGKKTVDYTREDLQRSIEDNVHALTTPFEPSMLAQFNSALEIAEKLKSICPMAFYDLILIFRQFLAPS